MKNSVLIPVVILLTLQVYSAFSQVGINTDTPNSRAVLDLNSPTNDQGLLVPRLSTLQRTAQAFTSRLTESENGLLVFDTNEKLFYYWMYPLWKPVEAGVSATAWRSGSEVPQDAIGEEGDFYLNVVDGSVYTKSGGQYILTANIKGQPGPQGLKGDQGEPGPVGPQGPIGLTGPQGAQGPIGLTGPQGVQGPIGLTGPEGPQGPIGLTGPEGPQGPIGLTGPEGAQGPIGLTGPQGAQGPIGLTGLEGPQGPIGLTGPEGAQGPIGITGPQGAQGPIGLTGPQGVQGPIGLTGPEGPQGPIGLTGPEGAQGPIGLTGPEGPQGPIGLTGPAGPQGEKGDTGAQGPIGPQGPQGEPGISTAFKAVSITTSYTATGADDVIIALSGNTTITLPSAGSVPGKVFHIRHNLGVLDLGSVTIRAPAGNSIIDGSAAQTFGIGGLLGITAVSIIAVDTNKWYIIGKF